MSYHNVGQINLEQCKVLAEKLNLKPDTSSDTEGVYSNEDESILIELDYAVSIDFEQKEVVEKALKELGFDFNYQFEEN